jgi:hypothetical protein
MDRRKFLGGAAALMVIPALANATTEKQIRMLKEKPKEELTKAEKIEIISYHLAEIANISVVPLLDSYCEMWDRDYKGLSSMPAKAVWDGPSGLPIIAVSVFDPDDQLWIQGKTIEKMKD